MPSLKVAPQSLKELTDAVDCQINSIRRLIEPVNINKVSKVAANISIEKFISNMNFKAKSQRKRFHHVYEWNKSGVDSARLFQVLKGQTINGKTTISTRFINSKTYVPIARSLREDYSGPYRKHKFVNKAAVMEMGKIITSSTPRVRVILNKKSQPIFLAPNTRIVIKNPGGAQVKGSFTAEFQNWFQKNYQKIFDATNITKKLEVSTASLLNANTSVSKSQVDEMVSKVLQPYTTSRSVF